MMLYISSEPYSDQYSCTAKMKVIFGVVFAAVVMVVGSAPTLSQVPGMIDPRQEYYRDVRSQYPQYVSPCAAAAAASAPIPAIAPAAAYQLNISPYHGYAQPSQPYYGAHYRSLEAEPEIMNYSDMDHMMSEHVQARYGYPAPRSYVPAATTAPVFGVFPNANNGGCNVPLLFSCTPSVVPGHVVPQQQHAADAYRGVEHPAHHEAADGHEEYPAHEHLNQAEAEPNHAMAHQ